MAIKAVSFQTGKELADYASSTPVAQSQILSININMSGWIDLIYSNAEWAYAAGSGGGTVSVPAGARVFRITAQDGVGAGGTIEIDGGDTITVGAGGAFDIDLHGAVPGGIDIVFSAGLDYYVDWTV